MDMCKRVSEVFNDGLKDILREFHIGKNKIELLVARRIFEHGFICGVIATMSQENEIVVPSKFNQDNENKTRLTK